MRKTLGALLAAAIAASMVAVTSGPAGSATTGLTCTKLGGFVTWSPPVPNNSTRVKSTPTIKANVSGCTGTTGISSGVVTLPPIKATTGNCTSVIAKPAKIAVPRGGSILWATSKSRSILGPVTLTPAGLVTYTVAAKIASGQFAAKTLTATAEFAPVGGGCIIKGVALTSATLKVKSGTKVVVK